MSAHHPSDTSADQGWSAMREILDREMPERRKRRGIIWWWPLGVAAGLALWFWIGGSLGRDLASLPPENDVASPSAPVHAHSTGDVEDASSAESVRDIKEQGGSDSNPGPKDDSGGTVSAQATRLANQHKRHFNSRDEERIPVSSHGARHIPDDTPGSIDPLPGDVVEVNGVIDPTFQDPASAHTPPGNATANSATRERSSIVDPLEGTIAALTLPERAMVLDVAAELPKHRVAYPGGFSLFASAGVHAGVAQGLGTQLGLGAGWQVLPGLSLQTSVERHWMDLDASLPGSAQDREFANADSPIVSDPLGQGNVVIPEGNLSNASSASDLTDLVSTVRHWRWSLGAQYRITPWLAAELGGGLDFGIRVQTRYPIIPGTGTSQDLGGRKSLLNDYGFVRSSTAMAFGGVAWTPVRWLEVFGRYTHAFSPYLDLSGAGITAERTGRTDKLGSFQLGVRAVIRP